MGLQVIVECQKHCTDVHDWLNDNTIKTYTVTLLNDSAIIFEMKHYIPEQLYLKDLNWYNHFLDLQAYPDFDSVLDIYTDAGKTQLGAVIV